MSCRILVYPWTGRPSCWLLRALWLCSRAVASHPSADDAPSRASHKSSAVLAERPKVPIRIGTETQSAAQHHGMHRKLRKPTPIRRRQANRIRAAAHMRDEALQAYYSPSNSIRTISTPTPSRQLYAKTADYDRAYDTLEKAIEKHPKDAISVWTLPLPCRAKRTSRKLASDRRLIWIPKIALLEDAAASILAWIFSGRVRVLAYVTRVQCAASGLTTTIPPHVSIRNCSRTCEATTAARRCENGDVPTGPRPASPPSITPAARTKNACEPLLCASENPNPGVSITSPGLPL